MATYRHWSVSLWWDPDDVPHCRILSPDKTEWRLILATLCGWRHCFVADQLWFMTRIREEEGCLRHGCLAYKQCSNYRGMGEFSPWLQLCPSTVYVRGISRGVRFCPYTVDAHICDCHLTLGWVRTAYCRRVSTSKSLLVYLQLIEDRHKVTMEVY